MMKRCFVTAFVSISLSLAAFAVGASARGIAASHRAVDRPLRGDTGGWVEESGTASYYGPAFHGHLAADGSRFDQQALTAAHPWLPFGTKVRVTLANTGRTVVVTITDRLYSDRRVVDLSVAAARHLGFLGHGLAEVTLAPA
jgi:rare lipoprotein A